MEKNYKDLYQPIEIPRDGIYRLIPEQEFNKLISLATASKLLKEGEMSVDLGKTIINYRKKKNIKQKELANIAGITIASLCNLENGKIMNPRQTTLKSLCGSLGEDFRKTVQQLGYLKNDL